jgi:hypothetical protein
VDFSRTTTGHDGPTAMLSGERTDAGLRKSRAGSPSSTVHAASPNGTAAFVIASSTIFPAPSLKPK